MTSAEVVVIVTILVFGMALLASGVASAAATALETTKRPDSLAA